MRLRLQFVCDCGAIEIGDNNAENVTQWSVIRQIQKNEILRVVPVILSAAWAVYFLLLSA